MKAARIFTMLLVARAAYGIVYLAATAGRWPLFWYYPLERRWAFEATPTGFAMGWFGTTALATLAAALAAAIVWLVSMQGPFARAIARPEFVIALARAGAMILLVDFVYFGWTLTHQTPTPLPAPACESTPP